MICHFYASNTVAVSLKDQKFFLEVMTVGSNAHMCEFQGEVTSVKENTLVAAAEVELYNGETGGWDKDTCEVTVEYQSQNEVSVTNNGKCSEFCGARAGLNVGQAFRK